MCWGKRQYSYQGTSLDLRFKSVIWDWIHHPPCFPRENLASSRHWAPWGRSCRRRWCRWSGRECKGPCRKGDQWSRPALDKGHALSRDMRVTFKILKWKIKNTQVIKEDSLVDNFGSSLLLQEFRHVAQLPYSRLRKHQKSTKISAKPRMLPCRSCKSWRSIRWPLLISDQGWYTLTLSSEGYSLE